MAAPFMALAQAPPGTVSDCPPAGDGISLPNPLGCTSTFPELLDKILAFLRTSGAIVASIMIVIGAFQILFAGGDPEKFATGRRTIVYTAIAYAIILLASGVSFVIKDFFSVE